MMTTTLARVLFTRRKIFLWKIHHLIFPFHLHNSTRTKRERVSYSACVLLLVCLMKIIMQVEKWFSIESKIHNPHIKVTSTYSHKYSLNGRMRKTFGGTCAEGKIQALFSPWQNMSTRRIWGQVEKLRATQGFFPVDKLVSSRQVWNIYSSPSWVVAWCSSSEVLIIIVVSIHSISTT